MAVLYCGWSGWSIGWCSRIAVGLSHCDDCGNDRPERLKLQQTWGKLLQLVDETVSADPIAGFTTFVGLCVSRDRIVGVLSGDSAALLVTDNRAVELTAGQRKNPPVGSGTATATTFDVTPIVPSRLLLMTDGVWKYVGWERAIDTARKQSGPEVISTLQHAARLPGSGRFQDDFTLVLVEMRDQITAETGTNPDQ